MLAVNSHTLEAFCHKMSIEKQVQFRSFLNFCQHKLDDKVNLKMSKGRVKKKTENIMNSALCPFGPSLHP